MTKHQVSCFFLTHSVEVGRALWRS